jgi:hypothetical protein
MEINKELYKLGEDNFINEGTIKSRIVLGNTFTTNMQHTIGWENRSGGKYKGTAMFTIAIDGTIYQHFSPNCFSNFFDEVELSESTISILIENEGWLTDNLLTKNGYINYVGHIYKREDNIIEKKWRNYKYWAPYTNEQMESAVKLVKELCSNYEIPLNVVKTNTTIKNLTNDNGVYYKSNFKKHYTDISPAWDFKGFKNKIEKK